MSFVGRADPTLSDRLIAELPGILNWALGGPNRLRARGRFEEPAECADALKRLIYKSDAAHGFVAEFCTLDPDAGVDKAIFYDTFRRYCDGTGSHAPPLKDSTEKLSALFPGISVSKRRTGSGSLADPEAIQRLRALIGPLVTWSVPG